MYNEPVDSSDLKSSSAVICARPCRLMGIWLNPAAADAGLVCYDNSSAASGKVIGKGDALLSSKADMLWFGPNGVVCSNGIYASVSGVGAEYIVYFSNL